MFSEDSDGLAMQIESWTSQKQILGLEWGGFHLFWGLFTHDGQELYTNESYINIRM